MRFIRVLEGLGLFYLRVENLWDPGVGQKRGFNIRNVTVSHRFGKKGL